MDPTVLAGIVGAVGAIIGGLMTSIVTVRYERKSRQEDRLEAEHRREDDQFQATVGRLAMDLRNPDPAVVEDAIREVRELVGQTASPDRRQQLLKVISSSVFRKAARFAASDEGGELIP